MKTIFRRLLLAATQVQQHDPNAAARLSAGGAITAGLLYGLSSGVATLATNAAGASVQAIGFAVSALTSGQATAGNKVGIATRGRVKFDTSKIAGGSLTAGAPVYLATAGGVTSTRPTTANELIQVVGIALSTTEVLLNVVPSAVKAQAAGTSLVTGV